jgi:regulatory protein YycI of two-component signal transduction system YycFG
VQTSDNPKLYEHAKQMISESRSDPAFLPFAQSAFDFLSASKQYQDLVNEYHPVSTMSQSEKIKKTAKVVGLSADAL